jgi:biopolymer transport protein ExbD/biopolymer transport protein TolR
MELRPWNERLLTQGYPIAALLAFLTVVLVLWVCTPFCNAGAPWLPRVSRADFLVGPRLVRRVTLFPDRTYLEAEPLEGDALAARLTALRTIRPDLRLLVSADREVPFGRIRSVVRAARDAGLREITLEVDSDRLPGSSP